MSDAASLLFLILGWILVILGYKRATGAELYRDWDEALRRSFFASNFIFWTKHFFLLLLLMVPVLIVLAAHFLIVWISS
jgi:hypothetical protein